MNILFIGSIGSLSLYPFTILLSSSHTVVGVCLSRNDEYTLNEIPVCDGDSLSDSLEGLALRSGIPVINLNQFRQDRIELLRQMDIDVIYVSCFDSLIPQQLLSIPRLGCFNIHPSYLPTYRGPVPLFWQLRDGLKTIGVSLHRVSTVFDAGPIVSQQTIALKQGSDNDEITAEVARVGGELIERHLQALENNRGVELPQDERLATHQTFPAVKDFTIDNGWSNLHIYNFICATRHWGQSYSYELDGIEYLLNGEVKYYVDKNRKNVVKSIDNQKRTIKIVSSIDVLTAQYKDTVRGRS